MDILKKILILLVFASPLFGQFNQYPFGHGPEGGAAADPILDAVPYVYLDATLFDVVDGDTVTSWTDLSGNNRHALQATTTLAPIFDTNVLNGEPVLDFLQANSYSVVTYGETLSQPNTIICVFLNSTPADWTYDGIDGTNRQMLYNASSEYLWYAGNNYIGPAKDASFHLSIVINDGASSSIRLDDATLSSSFDLGSLGAAGATLMSRYTFANPSSGKLAVFIVYDRAISLLEINDIKTFLNTRYALY